mgnify:CR=1 FL=1
MLKKLLILNSSKYKSIREYFGCRDSTVENVTESIEYSNIIYIIDNELMIDDIYIKLINEYQYMLKDDNYGIRLIFRKIIFLVTNPNFRYNIETKFDNIGNIYEYMGNLTILYEIELNLC